MCEEVGVDYGDDDRSAVTITITCDPEHVFGMLAEAVRQAAAQVDPERLADMEDEVTGWSQKSAMQAALEAAQHTSDSLQSRLRREERYARTLVVMVESLMDMAFPEWREHPADTYDDELTMEQRDVLRRVQEFFGFGRRGS